MQNYVTLSASQLKSVIKRNVTRSRTRQPNMNLKFLLTCGLGAHDRRAGEMRLMSLQQMRAEAAAAAAAVK